MAARAIRLREGARDRVFAYALLAPALLAVAALVVYPLVRIVDISTRIGRSMNFARISFLPSGTGNYTRMLDDPAFWNAVRVTVIYVGASVACAFAIGLATALVLDVAFPARRLFRTLLLLPWAVPRVVASVVFRWMFDGSFGVVNAMLRHAGITGADIAWFADGRTALAAGDRADRVESLPADHADAARRHADDPGRIV